MDTKVRFNEDGEPKGVDVTDVGDTIAHFTVSDGRAELSTITQRNGEDVVYGEDIQSIMGQVGKLPVIQDVGLPDAPDL